MEVPARTQKREAGDCLELEPKDSGQEGRRGGARQPLASDCRPVGDPMASCRHSKLGDRDKSLQEEAQRLLEAHIRRWLVPPSRPPCHTAC